MKYILIVLTVVITLMGLSIYKTEINRRSGNEKDWLYLLAKDKLDDLVATNYWSHTNSDGCDFGSCRVPKFAYIRNWIGENLYKGPCDIQLAFKKWEASPSHNEVMYHYATNEILLIQEYDNNMCYIVWERAID